MYEDDEIIESVVEEIPIEPEDLKPKKPSNRAPEGIRTFTVCRRSDETGISGEGVVIQGVVLAAGWCIVNWLTPAPFGSVAIFNSMQDFITTHIESHLSNGTIITFEDGEQIKFNADGTRVSLVPKEVQNE